MLDESKAIEKKIKSAVTDSGSEVRRDPEKPGVTNLIEILAAVRSSTPQEIEAEFAQARYGDLKVATAAAVVEYLEPVRERYAAAARPTRARWMRSSPRAPPAPARIAAGDADRRARPRWASARPCRAV